MWERTEKVEVCLPTIHVSSSSSSFLFQGCPMYSSYQFPCILELFATEILSFFLGIYYSVLSIYKLQPVTTWQLQETCLSWKPGVTGVEWWMEQWCFQKRIEAGKKSSMFWGHQYQAELSDSWRAICFFYADSIFRNSISTFPFLGAEVNTMVFPQCLVGRDLDWLLSFISSWTQTQLAWDSILCRLLPLQMTLVTGFKICPMTF